jgi:hypothetical protein
MSEEKREVLSDGRIKVWIDSPKLDGGGYWVIEKPRADDYINSLRSKIYKKDLESSYEDKSDIELGDGRIKKWRQVGENGGYWYVEHPGRTYQDKEGIVMPLGCPVCGKYMKKEDGKSYRKYQCCHICETDFVEGKEKEWKEGWRPDSTTMEYWISRREK